VPHDERSPEAIAMRSFPTLAVALLLATPIFADETPVKGKITAVDLFKNGLAVVRCEVTLGKPGFYMMDEVPQPIHGTYSVEGGATVETLVQMRDVEVPTTDVPPGNLQEDLAGKKVTIHFRGDKRAPAVGTMMKFKPAKGEDLVNQPNRFIILQMGNERSYIETSEIGSIVAADAGDTVKRSRPRLVLTLGATDKAETKVTIRYLTRGLAWAPSYKIDITDPKSLTLEQHAVVRNELSDLKDAEVRLISGYPSVQFSHVLSPLAPKVNWAAFFQQLGNGGGRDNDMTGNSVATQQLAMNNFRGATFDLALGAIPVGEGVDLHYQSIGKRTLAEGDSIALSVAKGKADYERVVEWLVPDNRNEYGRYENRSHGEDDSAWDALKFKNPLAFPMTTGPATVVSSGQFNGQRTSFWVNSGEETLLRVGKALSIRTRATEHEVLNKNGDRDLIWIGGNQYRRSIVEGELGMSNHRKETVQLLIRRRFSGDLVKAEGDPKSSLREEGVFSINKRNELLWALPLKSGEERILKYSYTVLVPH